MTDKVIEEKISKNEFIIRSLMCSFQFTNRRFIFEALHRITNKNLLHIKDMIETIIESRLEVKNDR